MAHDSAPWPRVRHLKIARRIDWTHRVEATRPCAVSNTGSISANFDLIPPTSDGSRKVTARERAG
ncbi:MAG: hypothetical protein EBV77_10615, partial [Gemmatimonadaceae bacterium]|nr:hypothetical protein [Gemmatimonadaceae bacterium]